MTDDLVGRLRRDSLKYQTDTFEEAAARIEALEGEADTAAELLALVLWADPGVKEAAARKAARDWWVARDEAIQAALAKDKSDG